MPHLQLIKDADKLPLELRQQVNDYVQFLLERYVRKPAEPQPEEEWFWRLIDLLDLATPDRKTITAPLIAHLRDLPVSDICLFDDVLSDKLKQLDAPKFMDVAATGTSNSSDMFLYARCAVIANGRSFYEQVINDPESFLIHGDFEELLSVTDTAFTLKTGKEYDHLPRSVYETMWNKETWGERAIDLTKV